MSAPSRKGKRNPRRKAGKAAKKRLPRKIAFRLTVEAQEMRVTYTPDNSRSEFAMGHFEFHSPHNPPRRIPVSPTGYWSHFVSMKEIASSLSGPRDFARAIALAAIHRKAPKGFDDPRQLALF